MNVFVTCINGMGGTAYLAQKQIVDIGMSIGYQPMYIRYCSEIDDEEINARLNGICSGVRNGDIVFLQTPTWNGNNFERRFLHEIRRLGGKIIIFVHDIIPIMFEGNAYLMDETIEFYNLADGLILPSYNMLNYIRKQGLTNDKIVIQKMWDHPVNMQLALPRFEKVIHYTDSMSSIAENWMYGVPLRLYGQRRNIEYDKSVEVVGPLADEQLVVEMAKGGFGLCWDIDSDNQKEERYSTLNASFKLSTYLAAGIPIIAKTNISCADIIQNNHLGILVESLDEAVEEINFMSEAEYNKYVNSVNQFAELLRTGYFGKKVLVDSVSSVLAINQELIENVNKPFVQENKATEDQIEISVIIPCHNEEKFLHRCFNSIKQQTFPFERLEIILVDDVSSDSTYEIMEALYEQYPYNVTIIRAYVNLKAGLARNLAMKYAKGKYISYIDADDYVDHTMLQKMYEKMIDTNSDYVEVAYKSVNTDTAVSERIEEDKYFDCAEDILYRKMLYMDLRHITVWGKLYKKDFLMINHIEFLTEYYEDILFFLLTTAYAKRVYKINEILYYYYDNPNSVMRGGTHYEKEKKFVNSFFRIVQDRIRNNDYLKSVYATCGYEMELFIVYQVYFGVFVRLDCQSINEYDYFKYLLLKHLPNILDNPYVSGQQYEPNKRYVEYLMQYKEQKGDLYE